MAQPLTSLSHKAATLKVHEWLVVLVLIATLGSLSGMAYLSKGTPADQERSLPAFLTKPAKIEVLIKGAVNHPGTYYLPAGTGMKEVLTLAQLSPEADLRRFNLDATLKKGRTINVPMRQMLKVFLRGEIKSSKEISVPKGTRLMDLHHYVEFTEQADTKNLNRKRKLKDGEIIAIQRKNTTISM